MKFLFCAEEILKEQFDAIANGLIANGHEVAGFNNTIYKAQQERHPDYFVFSEYTFNHAEVQHFINNKKPKYLIVGEEKILCSSGNTINLPSFASTLKYKPQIFSPELECDIVLLFDGTLPDLIHVWYSKFYRDYKVKIAGAFINCMGYIGLTDANTLVRLAKSARVTVVQNAVIRNSLLYNNIIAVSNGDEVEQILSAEADSVDQLIVDRKKNIVNEIKLGKLVCEKLSNSN